MNEQLKRAVIAGACTILAEAAKAKADEELHYERKRQRTCERALLWNVKQHDAVLTFVESLAEEAVISDNWYNNVLFQQPEHAFIADLRMSKDRFWELLDYLYPEEAESRLGAPATPRAKRFACALYRLFRWIPVHDVASKFGTGCQRGSVINHTHELVGKLVAKGPDVIRFPSFDEQQRSADKFMDRYGYPDLAFVGDGTHVPILSPRQFEQDYVNYKGFHSYNLSGIVSFDYQFCWINCGWPGVTGDSHVLKCSPLWGQLESGAVLKPGLRIGLDTAYPLRAWSAIPYRPPLNNLKVTHNAALSKARARAEHPWAKLFSRFRSLQLLTVDTADCPAFIFACCVLHNLLEQSHEPFDEGLLEVEPVFPLAALEQHDRAEDGDGMAAEDEMDSGADERAVVVGLRETPAQRRDRVAKEVWNRKYPDNQIAIP